MPGPQCPFPGKDSFHNCGSTNVRLAAERALKDKPFEHLQRIPPLPVPGTGLEFRVLSSEEQVREAAERLKNCAARYIRKVVAQESAFVGLFRKQKGDGNKMSTIIAMGELFADVSVSDGRIVTSWGQRVEACNKSLTKAQKQHFKRARQGFSKLWTKAVQDELDAVLPRQAAGERVIAKPVDQRLLAFRHLSVLGRRVALIKLARVIESEGYTPERKSLAQGFVEHALATRVGGTIPDVIVGSCLAMAGKARDSILLRAIMGTMGSKKPRRKEGDLTMKQWTDFWLSDLPMEPRILAEEMCRLLRTLPEQEKKATKLAGRVVRRLLNARLGKDELRSVARSVLDTVRQLDGNAKLTVLDSNLPFQRSDLMGALTEQLMSAAKARNSSLADRIISRLLKAGVGRKVTKEVLKQALQLDKDAKLLVLLCDLPFQKSDLMGTLTEPLMSAAKARDASLVDGIISRLLKAGVRPKETKEVLKQALRLDKDAMLMVLLSGLPFDFTDCESSTQPTASGRLEMQEHLLSYIQCLSSPAAEYVLLGLPLHKSTRQAFVEAFCRQAELGNYRFFKLLEKRLLDLAVTSDETTSQLVEASIEPLLSAAKARDLYRAGSIISRLLKAGVAASQTSGILEAARKLSMASKLVLLLSPLPFRSDDLVEALQNPLLSAADAGAVKVVQSITRRLLRANVEAAQTTGILEEAVKLKPSAWLILLLSDLPFVASPSLRHALTRFLFMFSKQHGAETSAIVKLIGTKLSASGMKKADADSILRSGIISGTTAQLRVLTSGLAFHSGTVRRLVPELASSLVEAAARNDRELVEEAERVLRQRGIRAEHTSSFLERACHARCYSFLAHSTLPFEPRVLTSNLAEAYLQELVEKADAYWQIQPPPGYWLVESDIELAFIRAGANQVAVLSCVLLSAADTLPPDAPVIRHLLERLVHIGIATPEADYLMDRIRPELIRLLSRSAMPFSESALARAGISHVN